MAKIIDLSRIRVLLVEPNEFMARIMLTYLKGYGIKSIQWSKDTEEAFAITRTTPSDIILIEQNTEPLDGIEFIKALRTAEDSPNPYVPIIMVTADARRARVEQARDAGVTEFVGKPVSAKILYERLISTVLSPRKFIRCKSYFGPDRRRKNEAYHGAERRIADQDEHVVEPDHGSKIQV